MSPGVRASGAICLEMACRAWRLALMVAIIALMCFKP
jgi:hypothetical protein